VVATLGTFFHSASTADGSLSICLRNIAIFQISSSCRVVIKLGIAVKRIPCFTFQNDAASGSSSKCYCGPNNLENLLSRLKQLDEVPRGVEQPNLRTTRPGYYIITTKLHAGRADFGMKISSKKSPTKLKN
jgi:hypothetical protein